MGRFLWIFWFVFCVGLGAGVLPGLAQQAQPSVAVMNFSTQGLTGDWWGQFEPGVALSDLVTDRLVNAGRFNVVERARLGDTMQEHRLDTSGAVDPETAVRAARLVGAHFLIEGNVVQFDQTGSSGASLGQSIVVSHVVSSRHATTVEGTPPPCYRPTMETRCPTAAPRTSSVTTSHVTHSVAGAVSGNFGSGRVTIKVSVRVVNVETGQIVEAFDDEQTQTANSWSVGGADFLTGTYGSYENANFISSTMGHLIDAEAGIIAAHIDGGRPLSAAPIGPSLTGRIIAVDSGYYIINLGSSRGVATGQYFAVMKVSQVRDPGTGRYLTVNQPTGRIEITSVSPQTAIGRRVSGSPANGQEVKSEP
ncbi:MAG: CsgG/HfaB family protein [Candidatus Tyrphobacter sp.]